MAIKDIFKGKIKEKVAKVFNSKIDREELIEELEELLILSDISADLTDEILSDLKKNQSIWSDRDDFIKSLKAKITELLNDSADQLPLIKKGCKSIILMVGINGSGKTTSSAKLGYFYKKRGLNVMMSAADTFRAAGSSQLSLWGEKLGLHVVGGDKGADPGSVVYNSLTSFENKDYDLLIIDTAGRVQTRDNLMKELGKIVKIVKKFFPDQPAEVLLTVDATMGQNTLEQARAFKSTSDVSGLVLTKIDGTAKGGSVLNIICELGLPVRFAGTGEREGDFSEFSAEEFVDSLFG